MDGIEFAKRIKDAYKPNKSYNVMPSDKEMIEVADFIEHQGNQIDKMKSCDNCKHTNKTSFDFPCNYCDKCYRNTTRGDCENKWEWEWDGE